MICQHGCPFLSGAAPHRGLTPHFDPRLGPRDAAGFIHSAGNRTVPPVASPPCSRLQQASWEACVRVENAFCTVENALCTETSQSPETLRHQQAPVGYLAQNGAVIWSRE